MRRAISVAALALAVAIGTTGCAVLSGGGGAGGGAAVAVTLTAAARLNPDDAGQSLPTVFRIALLAAASKAEAASYETLYRGEDALGPELLAQEEIVLSPGETATRKVVADKPARALLVVGIFRKPVGTSWRAIVPLERGKPRAVTFRAEDYRVERQ